MHCLMLRILMTSVITLVACQGSFNLQNFGGKFLEHFVAYNLRVVQHTAVKSSHSAVSGEDHVSILWDVMHSRPKEVCQLLRTASMDSRVVFKTNGKGWKGALATGEGVLLS